MTHTICISSDRLRQLRRDRDQAAARHDLAAADQRATQERRRDLARSFGRYVAEHCLTFEQIRSIAAIAAMPENIARSLALARLQVPLFDQRTAIVDTMLEGREPQGPDELESFAEGVREVFALI